MLDDPTFPGCWVTARPVGVFWMEDEKGPDAKIICVPAGDPNWAHVDDLDDMPSHLLAEIEHFFDVYKMLEPDKHSATRGYEGAEVAWAEIHAAIERYPGPESGPGHQVGNNRSGSSRQT
jgi:inorganic pyrophosphatase